MSDLPIETLPTPRLARWHTSSFELAVALSLLAWFWFELARAPEAIADPLLLEWVVAILVVDLLPVPSTVGLPFSLSFPLQLSVALLYPPAVAGFVVLLGSTDSREFRGAVSPGTALFNRAQIAWSVVIEGWIFHHLASLSLAVVPARPRGACRGDRGVRGERAARRRTRPAARGHARRRAAPRDARGRLRRVHVELHGPRALQRRGRDDVRRDRPLVDRRLHRAARVRETDVHADVLPAGGDGGAGREAARERVPGPARRADGPAEPDAVPAEPARGDRRDAARPAARRDDHGPRPLQGDQRHARPSFRRPAAEGDRPAPVAACSARGT